jgi:hypothetical protein
VGAALVAGYDAPIAVQRTARELGLTYDLAIDQSGAFARAFADRFPITVVVARDGRIVAVRVGALAPGELDGLVAQAG